MRDPAMVDKHTYLATEMLTEAEWKYAYPAYLYPYICPTVILLLLLLLLIFILSIIIITIIININIYITYQNEPKHNQHIGYSYLDEKKYENKSKFLGTFYKGENSTY